MIYIVCGEGVRIISVSYSYPEKDVVAYGADLIMLVILGNLIRIYLKVWVERGRSPEWLVRLPGFMDTMG